VAWESCAALAIAIAHAVRTGEAAADALAIARAWAERNASASLRATLEAAARDPAHGLDVSAPPTLQSLYNAFAQALAAPRLEDGVARSTLSGGLPSARAAAAGALLGALGGREAVPLRWRRLVLSCRPAADPPVAPRPRPRPLWPTDLLVLAERLLLVGRTED
jgi:hypothetical protein